LENCSKKVLPMKTRNIKTSIISKIKKKMLFENEELLSDIFLENENIESKNQSGGESEEEINNAINIPVMQINEIISRIREKP
jgi:hypothetical protein